MLTVQYASTMYTDILNEREMIISMTEQGNPLENCMAERVNGLIKALIGNPFATKLDAITSIPEIIDIYNKEQKHGSIAMMTPYEAHQSTGPIQNIWKKEPAIASV